MSQKKVLEDAMRQLEEIFVLYSRNTITDKGAVSQVNGTVLRSRQLSNSLTSNADDAVFLHKYATEVLPESIASSGAPGGDNPAQPKGAIIIYHNGQQDRGCRLEGTGDQITSGYVSPIKIADLMGNIAQSNTNVNKSVSNPKTNEPSLGLVEINSPFLSLPTRNVVPVALGGSSLVAFDHDECAVTVRPRASAHATTERMSCLPSCRLLLFASTDGDSVVVLKACHR